MTKKEAEAERKRIRGLIATRDKFLKEFRLKIINMEEKKSRAKNSLKGRKETKRTFEIDEYKRLAEKSAKAAAETLEKAANGNLERPASHKEVSFDSTCGVHPLNKMLQRQSTTKPTFVRPQAPPPVRRLPPAANISRQSSVSSASGFSGPPLASSSRIDVEDNLNTSVLEASFSGQKDRVSGGSKQVRGYVKVNAYNQLLEVNKSQNALIRTMNDFRRSQEKDIKVRKETALCSGPECRLVLCSRKCPSASSCTSGRRRSWSPTST